FADRLSRDRAWDLHEHDHGNQSRRARRESERDDRGREEGNVEGRAAPHRWASVRDSYSAAANFAASRSARASRAQLPGAQESSAGDQSSDEIFLGRLARQRINSVSFRATSRNLKIFLK